MQQLWENENLFDEVYQEEKSEMLNIMSFADTIDTDLMTKDKRYYQDNNIPMVFKNSSYESELGSKIFGDLPLKVESGLEELEIRAQDFENTIGLLANAMVSAWKGKSVSGYEMEQFFTAIKNPVFFLSFPKMLQSFRKFNSFKIESKSFKIIADMILMCLTQANLNFNVSVPLELINMAGTYYHFEEPDPHKKENPSKEKVKAKTKTKKVYLMKGIQNHKIFKNFDFWYASLIYTNTESKEGYDFHDVRYSVDQSIVKSGFLNQVTNNFMTMGMHMKEFHLDSRQVIQFMGSNIRSYKLPKSAVERLKTFLDSTFVPDKNE